MCVYVRKRERGRETERKRERESKHLQERNRQTVDRCICLPSWFGFQVEILAKPAKSDFLRWTGQVFFPLD
ncbi:hypothetical protein AMECASPLE_024578 [Ameca splendens]|uniref:Uncharacterized protein n=1 Tax=Ameca splendens TaxID=208324 RepID=A0ABV1ADC3_9TELE